MWIQLCATSNANADDRQKWRLFFFWGGLLAPSFCWMQDNKPVVVLFWPQATCSSTLGILTLTFYLSPICYFSAGCPLWLAPTHPCACQCAPQAMAACCSSSSSSSTFPCLLLPTLRWCIPRQSPVLLPLRPGWMVRIRYRRQRLLLHNVTKQLQLLCLKLPWLHHCAAQWTRGHQMGRGCLQPSMRLLQCLSGRSLHPMLMPPLLMLRCVFACVRVQTFVPIPLTSMLTTLIVG